MVSLVVVCALGMESRYQRTVVVPKEMGNRNSVGGG